MPEVDVKKKNQTQATEQQGEQQGQTNQPVGQQSGAVQTRGQQRGGLASRGSSVPFMFSLGPREFFSSSPFELMRRFTDEMDRVFETFGLSRGPSFGGGEIGMWSPTVEIFERDNNLIVRAELPGLNKDDVKVEMTEDGLVIQGERKREHEERREGVYRSERSYGQFYRLIPLPEGVDPDQVKAQFENGVLEITAPIPESQRRRRNIQIGEPTGTTGGQTQTATGGSDKK